MNNKPWAYVTSAWSADSRLHTNLSAFIIAGGN